MKPMPTLVLGLWNAWLLCAPMVVIGVLVVLPHKQVAQRLSDMTGYGMREKLFTVVASLLPYAFLAASAWTPLGPCGPGLVGGVLVSALGTVGFVSTLGVFTRAPLEEPILRGPYRLSRNPLYVSAALVFLGACIATGSPLLSATLLVLLVVQHPMILAEERACAKRYGRAYTAYAERTRRYLGSL